VLSGRWSLVSSLSAHIDGQTATWAEYLALPPDSSIEFIDGRLRVRPQASRRHQKVALTLAAALGNALPTGYDVTLAWAWKARNDEFIPDVMVHPATEEDARFTGVPALVAEVLSSDPGEDLMLHQAKYADAGLTHLWIADPTAGTLDILGRVGRGFRLVRRLVIAGSPVDVDFGVAFVRLDAAQLLA
jgi:Uma2 family endonuclease